MSKPKPADLTREEAAAALAALPPPPPMNKPYHAKARPVERPGPGAAPLRKTGKEEMGLLDPEEVRRLQKFLRFDFAVGIEAWLQQRYGMRRPPVVAGRLLAMLCDLHDANAPFPQRAYVCTVIGCSIYGVDVALNTALTRGDLSFETRLAPGHIAARESVLRHRYYAPSGELASLAKAYTPRKRA